MLIATLELIAASTPIRALRGSLVLYPLFSAAHIAGFGLMLGAIATWDIAVLRGRSPDALALSLARYGAVLAVAAGIVLFLCRGSIYLANPAFQVKLALLALALANVIMAHVRMGRDSIRPNAAVSLVLWPSIILAGRYTGFL